MGISEGKKEESGISTKTDSAIKWWCFCVIFWPLLCISFAGVILCDSTRNVDERIGDIFFTIIPLVFFAVGMSMRYHLLKERKDATAFAKAVVVSDGLRIQPGKHHFFPEFEFQAGEAVYRVRYPAGYSFRIVSEGSKVDLYYNPDNPRQFYVPAVRKHDKRLSLLLCGVGVAWPLLGLLAPWVRAAFSI